MVIDERGEVLLDRLLGCAAQLLACTYAQANTLVSRFEALQILREITGKRRNRVYEYSPYLRLFESSIPDTTQAAGQKTLG